MVLDVSNNYLQIIVLLFTGLPCDLCVSGGGCECGLVGRLSAMPVLTPGFNAAVVSFTCSFPTRRLVFSEASLILYSWIYKSY